MHWSQIIGVGAAAYDLDTRRDIIRGWQRQIDPPVTLQQQTPEQVIRTHASMGLAVRRVPAKPKG